MAAGFPSTSFQQQQHHPFLLDSLFLQNTTSTTTTTATASSSNINIHEPPPPPNYCSFFFNNNNNINQNLIIPSSSSSVVTTTNNTMADMDIIIRNKRKYCKKQPSNSAQSKDKRGEVILKGSGKKKKQKKIKKENNNNNNNSKEDCIHVRARRGQATDSHSLAERVRRERISERMKLLQSLVPGCDKVTGKALMLDEIINYVQSLQNQVEFLSMKLASVNPIMSYDCGVDLEPFMVRPADHQDLSHELQASPLPLECSPINNYNLLENMKYNADHNPIQLCMFQQPQLPNVLPQPQGSRHESLWEVDELRQKIINHSGFNHTLFSFH